MTGSSTRTKKKPLVTGSDGVANPEAYCTGCDEHGHVLRCCPHYNGRKRSEHADGRQPDAKELQEKRNNKEVAGITIVADIVRCDGSELLCFFWAVIKGLELIGNNGSPQHPATLQQRLFQFLSSSAAPNAIFSCTGACLPSHTPY
eukprot:2322222-Prymnesium_polylepis.1